MKIVITGTRGVPNVMGGVETHCEELFPRIAAMGEDVTLIRRASYVNDGLKEWKGVKLVDIATDAAIAIPTIIGYIPGLGGSALLLIAFVGIAIALYDFQTRVAMKSAGVGSNGGDEDGI